MFMEENGSGDPTIFVEEKVIQIEPKVSKRSENLQQKFKRLEKDWQSFTQSSLKAKAKQPLNNSPRELMSALQYQRMIKSASFSSPLTTPRSGEVWRVRKNELAKEEMKKERKFAFESRKLRGRRLFKEENEVGCDGVEQNQSICTEIDVEEGELMSNLEISDYYYWEDMEKQGMLCFCGGSCCSSGKGEGEDEKREREENEEGKEVERESNFVNGYGGRLVGVKFSIAITLIAFFLGVFGGFDDYGSGEKACLVPT